MGSLLCSRRANLVKVYNRINEAKVLDKSKDGEYQDKTINSVCVCARKERGRKKNEKREHKRKKVSVGI